MKLNLVLTSIILSLQKFYAVCTLLGPKIELQNVEKPHNEIQTKIPERYITNNGTTINEDTLEHLIFFAHLANIAYCPEQGILEWSCGQSTRHTKNVIPHRIYYNAKTSIRAYLAVNNHSREIYVCFRGSVSLTNWLYNFYGVQRSVVWKTTFPTDEPPKVHKGFYLGYQSIASQLIKDLTMLFDDLSSYSIKVIGHSLGGALATLCAVDIAENFQKIGIQPFLITFESPRVGNMAFAIIANQLLPQTVGQSIRVTHAHDIVVHLPLSDMGFCHVGQEIFIPPYTDKNIAAIICQSDKANYEDPSCSSAYREIQSETT